MTYVGRFKTLGMSKGLEDFVKSLAMLNEDVKGICVGGPIEYGESLYRIGNSVGLDKERLVILDRVDSDKLVKYMAASDVLVMPFPRYKHYEFFMSPLKMFEYMAAKRPIVASSLVSVREVIEDGVNGILVEPGVISELADGIKRALEPGAEELAKNALNKVKYYQWSERAERILKQIC